MPDQPFNIIIRHTELGDAEALHRIFTAPRVAWCTLQSPYMSIEAVRKRMSEAPSGLHQLVACVNGEVVGEISLSTSSRPRLVHVGQLGMAVRDDWQGKGIGSALMKTVIELADQWLQLRRIELHVYTDNEPAIALYKKFEFAIEGTHRAFAFRGGQYVDVYSMARLKNIG